MERLRKFDGVYQIRTDFSPGKNEMRLASNLKPGRLGSPWRIWRVRFTPDITVMKRSAAAGPG
jgi:hypothetical protein